MTAGRQIISQSQEWCTPPKYVDAVNSFFGGRVDLDPCSNDLSVVNAKTEYKLPKNDGIKSSWDYKNIYVNPPYGRAKEASHSIYHWLDKCCDAHYRHGSEVLALIPVAVNTKHWKEFIFGKATAVCFLADTRLKFLVNGSVDNKGAPMACSMIYWGKDFQKFNNIFIEFGAVLPAKQAYLKSTSESKSRVKKPVSRSRDRQLEL